MVAVIDFDKVDLESYEHDLIYFVELYFSECSWCRFVVHFPYMYLNDSFGLHPIPCVYLHD